jgi:hypothetical protein
MAARRGLGLARGMLNPLHQGAFARRTVLVNTREAPLPRTAVRRVTYYRFGQPAPGVRRSRAPPRWVWIGLGGAGVYYVAHLEKVEETGRLRLALHLRRTFGLQLMCLLDSWILRASLGVAVLDAFFTLEAYKPIWTISQRKPRGR